MKVDVANTVGRLVAAQLRLSPDAVKSKSTVAELGGDSLDEVELVIQLEHEFHVDIPDEDALELRTLEQLTAYIDEQIRLTTRIHDEAPVE